MSTKASKRFLFLWSSLAVAGGCQQILGISDYEVDPKLGGSIGGEGGESGKSGTAGKSGIAGKAGFAGEPGEGPDRGVLRLAPRQAFQPLAVRLQDVGHLRREHEFSALPRIL